MSDMRIASVIFAFVALITCSDVGVGTSVWADEPDYRASEPMDKMVKSCLADYLLKQHNDPSTQYRSDIFIVKISQKDFFQDIMKDEFKDTRLINEIAEQKLNFRCKNPAGEANNTSGLIAKTGNWPKNRYVVTVTECSVEHALQHGNIILVHSDCNTDVHHAPTPQHPSWCKDSDLGDGFIARFSNRTSQFILLGNGFSEGGADIAPRPCSDEDDPSQ